MEYSYKSHTVFQIEYHFVWVTKYRYPVPRGEVVERRIRELVRETCEAFEIRIARGEVHYFGSVFVHALARSRASAICARVIFSSTIARFLLALSSPPALARLNHMCASM